MRQAALKSLFFSRASNFLRIIAKTALAALIGMVCLCVGVWVFLQIYGPRIITSEIERLQSRTGIEIAVGFLDVTFLPLPALAISDVRIKGHDFELILPWSFVRPAFLPLMEGAFLPAELTFLRPRLAIGADEAKIGQLLARLDGKGAEHGGDFDWQAIFGSNCRIRVSQLDARVGSANLGLFISNLSGDVETGSDGTLAGSITMDRIGLRDATGPKFVARRPRISAKIPLNDFARGGADLHLQMGLAIPGHFTGGMVEVAYKSANGKDLASFSISGDLLLEGRREAASVLGSLDYDAHKNALRVYRTKWKLGADSGSFLADVSLPGAPDGFSASGDFTARRLSLTQWFGFARNLAPGLQLSLDNVYNVNLEFRADSTSLEVPSINASCNGSAFTGSGGVKNFAEPVVSLNLETDKTNLALALEESVGISPLPPSYAHAPLTPMPGEPVREDEINIGYDINIGAKTLLYGPLTMRNAALRIYPGKIDKDGLEEVLLDAKADFYGGKMKGACVLGGPASLPITIEGNVSGVNGAALGKDLPFWPFAAGVFQANAKVSSEGRELKAFLANLRGNVMASGARASLGSGLPLEKLETACALKGGTLQGNKVVFEGDWRCAAQTREASASISLGGKISFGEAGADFRNLRWKGNAGFQKEFGIIPAGLKMQGSGLCSLNMGKNEIILADSVLESPGVAIKGSLNLNFKNAAIQGKIATARLDFSRLLSSFGIGKVALPPDLRPIQAEAELSGVPDTLKFENLRIRTSNDNIAGSLEWRLDASKPDFIFDLVAGKFAIPKTSGHAQSSWNLSALKAFNARGVLSLKILEGWQGSLHNIRAPLRLENGLLSVNGASASFCGGSVSLSGKADCNGAGTLEAQVAVKGVDLAQAAKEQKLEIALGGKGFFNATLRTKGNTSAKLVENLDGVCDFMASNGYWQSLDKAGRLKGKPTQFSKMQASAKVVKGRFTTNDFILSGPSMNIDGKGYLNLVKKDLDYTLNVNMKGVPDFPLYIYGPFDKPKTRVGAGRLVLNALGSVATGLGNFLGGFGDGLAKLFK